jgi:exonuclease V
VLNFKSFDDSIGARPHDLMTGREGAPAFEARQAIATFTTTMPRRDSGSMAAFTAPLTNTDSEYGSHVDIGAATALSDYGSDFGVDDIDEDTILSDVLETIQDARPAAKDSVLPSIEFEEGEREDEDHDVDGFVHIHRPTLLRVSKGKDRSIGTVDARRDIQSSPLREHEALEVEYDERSRRAWSGTSSCNEMNAPRLTTNSV